MDILFISLVIKQKSRYKKTRTLKGALNRNFTPLIWKLWQTDGQTNRRTGVTLPSTNCPFSKICINFFMILVFHFKWYVHFHISPVINLLMSIYIYKKIIYASYSICLVDIWIFIVLVLKSKILWLEEVGSGLRW